VKKRWAPIVRCVMYALRGGFLVRPLVISAAISLLGAVFSSLEGLTAEAGTVQI
jgi:hypothetical protein